MKNNKFYTAFIFIFLERGLINRYLGLLVNEGRIELATDIPAVITGDLY